MQSTTAESQVIINNFKLLVNKKHFFVGLCTKDGPQIFIAFANNCDCPLLNDAGLLSCNMSKCWSSKLHMVKCDVCNDRDIWLHNIGCIPTTQHSYFNNCHINGGVGEPSKRCSRHDFKIGRPDGGNTFSISNSCDGISEVMLADYLTIYLYALTNIF